MSMFTCADISQRKDFVGTDLFEDVELGLGESFEGRHPLGFRFGVGLSALGPVDRGVPGGFPNRFQCRRSRFRRQPDPMSTSDFTQRI